MFTGIITDIGKIISISNTDHRLIKIGCSYDENDIDIGASIACSGVCLTVINKGNEQNQNYFEVEVSQETDDKTTTKFWKEGTKINLEKSLKVGDEIGGHFVYGHVDRTTKLHKLNNLDNSWEFCFNNFENNDSRYIVDKASIAINGISLTIANVSKEFFSISVISHTYDNTNLKFLKKNDYVNVEFDYLARFSSGEIYR